MNTDNILYK